MMCCFVSSSSPVHGLTSAQLRPKLIDSITPDSSFSEKNSASDVENEHLKSNIEPKNLLDVCIWFIGPYSAF